MQRRLHVATESHEGFDTTPRLIEKRASLSLHTLCCIVGMEVRLTLEWCDVAVEGRARPDHTHTEPGPCYEATHSLVHTVGARLSVYSCFNVLASGGWGVGPHTGNATRRRGRRRALQLGLDCIKVAPVVLFLRSLLNSETQDLRQRKMLNNGI